MLLRVVCSSLRPPSLPQEGCRLRLSELLGFLGLQRFCGLFVLFELYGLLGFMGLLGLLELCGILRLLGFLGYSGYQKHT